MGDDDHKYIGVESRAHYRLNRDALDLARRRLQEVARELCRRGVYGRAQINLKITDGIIADVEVVRSVVSRIRRRRTQSSLSANGRQGDMRQDEDEDGGKTTPSSHAPASNDT